MGRAHKGSTQCYSLRLIFDLKALSSQGCGTEVTNKTQNPRGREVRATLGKEEKFVIASRLSIL